MNERGGVRWGEKEGSRKVKKGAGKGLVWKKGNGRNAHGPGVKKKMTTTNHIHIFHSTNVLGSPDRVCFVFTMKTTPSQSSKRENQKNGNKAGSESQGENVDSGYVSVDGVKDTPGKREKGEKLGREVSWYQP